MTTLVECNRGVVVSEGTICARCGRPESAHGLFSQMNQLVLPKSSNTFFTTKEAWPRAFTDRDLFVTEDVVRALKAEGLKGAYCERLLTDDEATTRAEKVKKGLSWRPPEATVRL